MHTAMRPPEAKITVAADGSGTPDLTCWPRHGCPIKLELVSEQEYAPWGPLRASRARRLVPFLNAARQQEQAAQLLRGVDEATIVDEMWQGAQACIM